MPIIEFGRRESLLSVGARGAFGGKSTFIVPKFGKGCVCCGTDAMGRTQDYDPSTDRIQADAVPMPVCFACRDHAFQGHTGPIIAAAGFCVGVSATILGAIYLGKRPHDTFLWGVLAVGIAILALSLWWIVRSVKRERRDRDIPGHHARLWFSVGQGATRIITRNEALADELIALNPAARRFATRAEAKKIPAARVVDGNARRQRDTDTSREDDAALVAQKILSGKPADLDAVRAMLARGSVSDVLVEGHLAEIEETLGRSDLRPRYRAVRAESAQTS